MSPLEVKPRWRSIPAAQSELNTLVESGINGDALARQRQYSAYLDRRRLEFSATNVSPLTAVSVT